MHPKDPRLPSGFKPLEFAMSKFNGRPRELPFHYLEDVAQYLDVRFQAFRPVRRMKKMMTTDEAVRNLEIEGYNRVNPKTSEGYPWILKRPSGMTGAQWMFEENEDNELVLIDNDVRRAVEERCEEARKNKFFLTIFAVTPKDERRPINKIWKTRIFCAGPKDYTIYYRKHLLDFWAALQKEKFSHGFGVGTNPHSFDWTHWYRALVKRGENFIAGDYANFDGMLHPRMVRFCIERGMEWMRRYCGDFSEHENCYINILEDACYPTLLVQNDVYKVGKGEASGAPDTAAKNTLLNEVYIILCYLELAKQNDILFATLQQYDDNVYTLCYGDDVVMSVTDQIKDWFNMGTISKWFEVYGITFTDPAKLKITRNFVPPNEVTFLKRYFRPAGNGIVYAPMEPKALFEILNWVRVSKFNTPQEALRSNAEDVIRDSLHYGRVAFRHIKNKINVALVKVGIKPISMIYSEQHLLNYGVISPDLDYNFFKDDPRFGEFWLNFELK